jgi:hypothetical protein
MSISSQDSQFAAWSNLPATPAAQEEAWQKWVNRCAEWRRSPSTVDEDEMESPSVAATDAACGLLAWLRNRGGTPPQRLVGDGEGGIVLELRTGANIEEFRIGTDGNIEHLVFADCRLVSRQAVQLP